MTDRTEINRALSKSIAYLNVNKKIESRAWAMRIIDEMVKLNLISYEYIGTQLSDRDPYLAHID